MRNESQSPDRLNATLLVFKIISSRGPSINYVVSRGEGGGQKLPILLSKKTTKRGHCVLKWVLVISVVF